MYMYNNFLIALGAVKLTPGHDQTDWEVGQKHNLDLLEILDDKGDLVNVPESFQVIGMINLFEKGFTGRILCLMCVSV